MGEVHKMFADTRLLQGAPLMPAEAVEAGSEIALPAGSEPEPKTGTKQDQMTEEEDLIARSKEIICEAIISGWASKMLDTAAKVAEKTKERIRLLEQIIAAAKIELDQSPEGGKLAAKALSEGELFWELIQVPEFRKLVASGLTKMLRQNSNREQTADR